MLSNLPLDLKAAHNALTSRTAPISSYATCSLRRPSPPRGCRAAKEWSAQHQLAKVA